MECLSRFGEVRKGGVTEGRFSTLLFGKHLAVSYNLKDCRSKNACGIPFCCKYNW